MLFLIGDAIIVPSFTIHKSGETVLAFSKGTDGAAPLKGRPRQQQRTFVQFIADPNCHACLHLLWVAAQETSRPEREQLYLMLGALQRSLV